MDTRLFDMIDKDVPQFNRQLVRGLACEHLKRAKQHIDRIIRCAEEQYPEGLEFVESTRCTPMEEYNEITKARGNANRVYDLAKSDVYLVKYQFKYKGENLRPRYLYLPHVRQGGIINIMGKQFAISPVLADKVFSIGVDDIFIPMPRGKVTFNCRELHHFVADDTRVGRYVVWSPLHNRGAKKGRSSRSSTIQVGGVYSTLMHYLLCKYGLDETFQRYGKAKVQVMWEHEADETRFPRDEWVVCKSAKIKPKGLRVRDYPQIASKLALVVRRSEYTPAVVSMVAGLFYVVDHFPEELEPEYVSLTWTWRVLMGYILFGDESSQGKLVEDVDSHLKSLDGYVDFEVRQNLKDEGIDCQNIYDLFGYIIDKMPEMLNSGASKVSSMYDKQLMVNRYVLSDINNAIFEFLFKIVSNNKKQMSKEEIDDILGSYFNPKLILRISSGKGHGEVSSVSNPSDNLFFKITSVLVQQSDTAGKGKGRETKPIDQSMYLDASYAECGGICVLPKSSPIGKDRANPFLKMDADCTVVRDPQFITLLNSLQSKIAR